MNTDLSPAPAPAPSQPQTPLAIIDAAVQKDIDPASLEKLMELQERWDMKQAKTAYNQAMVAFQSSVPTIHKGRVNEGTRSKYASFDDIMRIIRPELQRHGLAVTFSQTETPDTITITCRVMHRDGHSEESPFSLPKDDPIKSNSGKRVTNLAQAQGSANSYAKRYCLCNALNLVTGDQDDDAAAASMPLETVTEDQAAELRALIEESGADEASFLEWARVSSLADVPKVRFGKAAKILRDKLAKKEGAQQ